ncbi:hypothetical protein ASA1KI_27650 [Opitutales bacterium ASA1]|nr:hypothetical protein ASA1KI_27650 [Opitutales bacterium ASA1]
MAPVLACACSCGPPPEPYVALQEAATVFFGTAIARSSPDADGFVQVRFRVDQTFKGWIRPEVTICTMASEASCGFPFELGTDYLVYAYSDEDGTLLFTHLCARTRDGTEQRGLSLGEEIELLEAYVSPSVVAENSGIEVSRTSLRDPSDLKPFEGAAEKERVRLLRLIDGVRETEVLRARLGEHDSAGEWYATGTPAPAFRVIHFRTISTHLDLDLVEDAQGAVRAFVLTRKTPSDSR